MYYQGLDVSDIGKPDLSGISVVCEMHLFPRLNKLDGVDPLVAPRAPNVVEVVVYTCPSSAVGLVSNWNPDQVTRVVVGPKECY